MKPLRCFVAVFFLVLTLSFSAHALLPVGTWNSSNTPPDFPAGTWEERLWGGGEGIADNEITALSGGYFIFKGAILEIASPDTSQTACIAAGGLPFRTQYLGGTLTLITNNASSPWYVNNDADPYEIDLKESVVLTCKYTSDNTMSFALQSQGIFRIPFPKYEAIITADFAKAQPNTGTYEDPDPEKGLTSTIWGNLTSAQITITGPAPAAVDIKPGSCPNPINVKSRGVIPMAILGGSNLDVRSIDEETIYLTNGVVEVKPIRKAYENVGKPYDPLWPKDDRMACTNSYDGDENEDMTLKFLTEDVVAAFKLTEVPDREIREWFLIFNMDDGTQMVGSDVVWILNKERNNRNRDQSGQTHRMKHQNH